VTVVHDPMKNAFVLPSGNIFVFTGMLEVITDGHLVFFYATSHMVAIRRGRLANL
jgi:hypothetical protein